MAGAFAPVKSRARCARYVECWAADSALSLATIAVLRYKQRMYLLQVSSPTAALAGFKVF